MRCGKHSRRYAQSNSCEISDCDFFLLIICNIQDNPGVYELKNKQVKCYDEMYALWAKDRATGTSSLTAKEKRKRLNNEKQSETVEVEESDTFCEKNGVTLENFDTSDDIQITSPPPQQAKLQTKSNSKKKKS